jgi:PAS domain S-box-containing protein
MRETGIDFLGPLPWGTHFCLFYETKGDLIEILVPYFKSGLENNEFCMWVTSEPLKAQAAKRALRRAVKNLDDYIEKGQIEILPHSQWYTKSGRFEADEVLQGWVEKEAEAVKSGFDGLRLSGNTFWLEREDWKDFADYEVAVNDLILEHRMLAICTYSLDKCGASEIMDVVSSHQFATVRHNNKWEAVENAEQRRAQETLRESEERFRSLFENSTIGLYRTTPDGHILLANPTLVRMLGYSSLNELALRNLEEEGFDPGYPRTQFRERVEREGEVKGLETAWTRRDGSVIFVRESAKAIRGDDGTVLYYEGTVEDITQRKRAEEALREVKEFSDDLIASMQDGFSVLDSSGVHINVNSAFCQMTGFSREELIGVGPPHPYWPPEAYEEIERTFQKTLRGEFANFELTFMRKNGERFPVILSPSWIKDKEGNVISYFATVKDITQRKRAEEEISHRAKQLALINEVGQRIAPILELNELYKTVVEAVQEKFGYQNVAILSVRGDEVALEAVAGPEAKLMPPGYTQKVGEGMVGWVAQTGETLLANDVTKEPRFLPLEFLDMAAELDVPIRLGGKTIGVLLVDSDRPDTFYEADVTTLETIADQVARAIENARLYEETRHEAEELAALHDVSLDVAAQLEIQELLQTILERAIRLLNARGGGIYLYDPAKREIELRASHGYFTKDYIGTRLALGEGLSGKVAQTGEPLVVEDYAHWEGTSLKWDGEPSVNGLGVPLKRGDELQGVLFINHEVGEGFDEADIRLATLFANQAAIAIENARLYEETKRRAEELAALNVIAMTVSSTLDLQEVLQAIQERVMELLGERYAPIFALFNEEDQTFEVVLTLVQEEPLRRAGKLMGMEFEKLVLSLPALKPAVREALLAGKPYLTDDGSDLLGPGTSTKLVKGAQRAMGVRWIVDLPLLVKGKLVGTMVLFSQKEKIVDEEMELLASIANQAAIAIENARLYEQTDEKLGHRVAELTALNVIAQSLTRSLELDEILESIVTHVAQVMQARICTIRLVKGNELTVGAAVGYRDEASRQHTIKIDKHLARIVRDQQPLVVEDLWVAKDIPPSRRMRAWREEVHSFLGVPMISKRKTIGVLSIYREKPHLFSEEEVRLLSTIANQAAIAIEDARLHEKVREHTEELERLVQERTKELQAIHAELLQSAKLAALGQLAAGVAHELNNPLGAISGYLELLKEEMELGPQEMDYMERMEKRIQQSTKIVAELRSLGMPSEPVWQIVNVNDILEGTLSLVERRLSFHQIKVQKDITPALPLMRADPDRLEQVFINLITNARQAMEEGGTLRVASRESRNGEWVEIIFADTGEGIAKEHLGKIFDPFFTTRSPGKGMGLGLSLSHRHIKDHGGAIDVWSEKGRGTVFRVALPPSGAKRCWEIIDCDKKERCKAVRENADCRCWSVMEDVSRCKGCEVYRRKALPPLDELSYPNSVMR